jgi:hypothetical protein
MQTTTNLKAGARTPAGPSDRSTFAGYAATLALLPVLASISFARCQTVRTAQYSLCVPSGWSVDRDDRSDRVTLCKLNAGRCEKYLDPHPYPGSIWVDVQVADRGYDVWKSPEDLIRRARLLRDPVPQISDVPLGRAGAEKRTCWVARQLLYGDLWDETYGLVVDGRKFHVRVFYNNEPENIGTFRSTIIDILSSLRAAGRQ